VARAAADVEDTGLGRGGAHLEEFPGGLLAAEVEGGDDIRHAAHEVVPFTGRYLLVSGDQLSTLFPA